MITRVIAVLSTLVLLATASLSSADTVTFELIPNALSANDMSPDGRYVVGDADLNGDGLPDARYLWDTVTNTMTILPPPGLSAVAVSDDGTVVLGDMPDPATGDPDLGVTAGKWTAATGWVSLGYLPHAGQCPSRSDGYELSSDGSVAVGLSWEGCSGRGFRWTQAGMVAMQPLANGACRASVVSGDGSLIAGFCQGTQSRTPVYWNAAGQGQLLDPPNGDARGEVQCISRDGTVMLGTWGGPTDSVDRGVKWTLGPSGWQRTLVGNGSMRPGWTGEPFGIADDGTIVGFDFLIGNRLAWIQPKGTGPLLDLSTYITDNGGVIPDNFQLEVCQAISANGRYIVGHSGYYSQGAWRVTIDKLGDINLDGKVDLVDANRLAAVLVDAPLNPADVARCDIDQNGVVDGRDISAFVGVLLTQ